MKKEIRYFRFSRKRYFLLGKRKDGVKVWLEQGSFDCGWYWGFGYLEVVNRPGTDIKEHYHFSNYFDKGDAFEAIKEDFEELTIDENELWDLLDLMKTFYILDDVALIAKHGNAWVSGKTIIKELQNAEIRKWALEMQYKIIVAVQMLLSPKRKYEMAKEVENLNDYKKVIRKLEKGVIE